MLITRRSVLSLFFYADGEAMLDIPCALRDSRERRNTERERDEGETHFESQRRACRAVLRAGFFHDDHARAGRLG